MAKAVTTLNLARRRIVVQPPDLGTRVQILDSDLMPLRIPESLGLIEIDVPDGAYLVNFQRGDRNVRRLVTLDERQPEAHVILTEEDAPPVFTFAPLARVRPPSDVRHQEFVSRLCEPSVLPPAGYGTLILAVWRFDDGAGADSHGAVIPVQIRDADNVVPRAELTATDEGLATGIWGLRIDLPPGAYRLAVPIPDGEDIVDTDKRTERVVSICAGWQTLICMPTRRRSDGVLAPDMARMSLFITQGGFSPDRLDLRLTESALGALSIADAVPSNWLPPSIWRDQKSPILTICAGLLHLRREVIDVEMMTALVGHLKSTVGDLPDVVAIECGMAVKGALPKSGAGPRTKLATPPMLFESWRHLLAYSIDQPDIFPARSLSNAVGETLVGAGPWLTWIGRFPLPDKVAGVFWEWPHGSFHQLAEIASRQLTRVLADLTDLPEEAREEHLRRFTRAQRHVALTVWPLLDPLMRSLARHVARPEDESADRNYLESAVDLINGTRSHAGHAFRAAWTLLLALIAHTDFEKDVRGVFDDLRTLPEQDMICLMPAILSNWPNATRGYRIAALGSVGVLAHSTAKSFLADMALCLVESTEDLMQQLTLAVAGIDVLMETVPDRRAERVHDAFQVLWQTYSQNRSVFELEVNPDSLEDTFKAVFGPSLRLALPRVPMAPIKSTAKTVSFVVNQHFPVRLQESALGNLAVDHRALTAQRAGI